MDEFQTFINEVSIDAGFYNSIVIETGGVILARARYWL